MPPLSARSLGIIAAGFLTAGGIVLLLLNPDIPAGRPAAPRSASASPTNAKLPHRYNDPETKLERVRLSAVYFIPRDRQGLAAPDWRETLQKALEETRAFHRLQFSGRSKLEYTIIETPLTGEREGLFYDGTDTNRGNPQAWRSIQQEVDRRLGRLPMDQDALHARLILYEGVGALGGERAILVSSGYLRTPYAASTVYHELGHVFGLPDAYEYGHGTPLDEDIMGLGRTRPIGEVYLSEQAKRGMGLD